MSENKLVSLMRTNSFAQEKRCARDSSLIKLHASSQKHHLKSDSNAGVFLWIFFFFYKTITRLTNFVLCTPVCPPPPHTKHKDKNKSVENFKSPNWLSPCRSRWKLSPCIFLRGFQVKLFHKLWKSKKIWQICILKLSGNSFENTNAEWSIN